MLLEGGVGGVDACRLLVAGDEFADRFFRAHAQFVQHRIGKTADLDLAFVSQLLEKLGIAGVVFRAHPAFHVAAGGLYDVLQVVRQSLPGLLVYRYFQDRARFMPARVIVVLGHFMQAEAHVVERPHPFGGIHAAGLHGGIDFTAGQHDRRPAGPSKHFSAQAGNAHLQALEVLRRVDFPVEPAAHLGAGVAAGEHHHSERLVEFPPQFQAAAEMQPGGRLRRRHAEGNGAEELRRFHLRLPIVGNAVSHFGGARGDGVEHLERRHQFAGRIDMHLDPASGGFCDGFRKKGCGCAGAREIGRPGRDHLPVEGFGGC